MDFRFHELRHSCASYLAQSELICKDGKKVGKQTWWYANGQIKEVAHYKDGKKDGKDTYWYESGQIKQEGNCKDGEMDGKGTRWHQFIRKENALSRMWFGRL